LNLRPPVVFFEALPIDITYYLSMGYILKKIFVKLGINNLIIGSLIPATLHGPGCGIELLLLYDWIG